MLREGWGNQGASVGGREWRSQRVCAAGSRGGGVVGAGVIVGGDEGPMGLADGGVE